MHHFPPRFDEVFVKRLIVTRLTTVTTSFNQFNLIIVELLENINNFTAITLDVLHFFTPSYLIVNHKKNRRIGCPNGHLYCYIEGRVPKFSTFASLYLLLLLYGYRVPQSFF